MKMRSLSRVIFFLFSNLCLIECITELDSFSANKYFDEASIHHDAGNYHAAIRSFKEGLSLDNSNHQDWFDMGVSLMHAGLVNEASEAYSECLDREPDHPSALINLASLHHKFGDIADSIPLYEKVRDLLVNKAVAFDLVLMNRFNLIAAYFQLNMYTKSKLELKQLDEIHEYVYDMACNNVNQVEGYPEKKKEKDCEIVQESIENTIILDMKIKHSSVDWNNVEVSESILLKSTLKRAALNMAGPLLVFDTFLMYMSPYQRFQVAQPYNDKYSIDNSQSEIGIIDSITHLKKLKSTNDNKINNKLVLGFMSYDFNDHPTAHMVEGIFQIVSKARKTSNNNRYKDVELIIYSYSKEDDSKFQKELIASADRYEVIAHDDYITSAKRIKADGVHVLLEMQILTLGNRIQISAFKPAALQINYLVFPGTSGLSFLDLLFCDNVIIPPEHALYYSEKLLMVPGTYQISYFDRILSEAKLPMNHIFDRTFLKNSIRNELGLPTNPNAIILCNFNKVDKIDRISFGVWMNILKRLGNNAYLWLNLPKRSRDDEERKIRREGNDQNGIIIDAIKAYAIYHGINPDRILFAVRADKIYHITRHAAADLFIDTVGYGAHSTATDSLRGGLPVLTMEGGGFPTRVGSSIYNSFITTDHKLLESVLVTHSLKEFEDTAVRLCSNVNGALKSLKYTIQRAIKNQDALFSAKYHVDNFINAMLVAVEERALDNIKRHVIVGTGI